MRKTIIHRLPGLVILISLLVGTNLAVHASAEATQVHVPVGIFNPATGVLGSQAASIKDYGVNESLQAGGSPGTTVYLQLILNGSKTGTGPCTRWFLRKVRP